MADLKRRSVLFGIGALTGMARFIEPSMVLADPSLRLLNVRDFGAVGDGNTDDSDAIFAAIQSVPNGGGLVYIPAGTYLIPSSKGLVCDKSGIRLVGESNASVLRFSRSTGPAKDLLTISSASDIAIQGLIFDGNVEELRGVLSSALRFSKVSNSLITDCVFTNCPGSGVYLEEVSRVRVTRNRFEYCDLSGVYLAMSASGNSCNDQVLITDNRLENCQATGIQGWAAIQARAAGDHRNIEISNNTIINPGWIGISVDNVFLARIVGNVVIKPDRSVRRSADGYTPGSAKGECISFGGEGCIISNNYCRNDSMSLASCIILYTGPPGKASAPVVRNNLVSNNRCTNSNSGIDLVWAGGGEFSNLWVQGNMCFGNTYGIRSMVIVPDTSGIQSNVMIVGNNLSGNTVPLKLVADTDGIRGAPTVWGNIT